MPFMVPLKNGDYVRNTFVNRISIAAEGGKFQVLLHTSDRVVNICQEYETKAGAEAKAAELAYGFFANP